MAKGERAGGPAPLPPPFRLAAAVPMSSERHKVSIWAGFRGFPQRTRGGDELSKWTNTVRMSAWPPNSHEVRSTLHRFLHGGDSRGEHDNVPRIHVSKCRPVDVVDAVDVMGVADGRPAPFCLRLLPTICTTCRMSYAENVSIFCIRYICTTYVLCVAAESDEEESLSAEPMLAVKQ
jgi:hypothetical protein